MQNKFCVFILSHGRADRVYTYDSLRSHGYTGEIKILIDDEDLQSSEYMRKYPGEVLIFCKKEWAKKTDVMDNFPHRKAIVYARNAVYIEAERLGYKYFLQLDDDYTDWQMMFDDSLMFGASQIKNLDNVFSVGFDFLQKTNARLALAQGGDYIGGGNSGYLNAIKTKRKCMNTWFCDTKNPVVFTGHMNEDCSAYVVGGLRGGLFIQTYQAGITQKATQANSGGMTDTYLSSGTYLKTFYTVMLAPSCTKINTVTPNSGRIHHSIKWNNCAPKILRESVRKL